ERVLTLGAVEDGEGPGDRVRPGVPPTKTGSARMDYRFATAADVPVLATMNQQLIRDEGHRNAMTLPALERRMGEWLAGGYRAVLFEETGEAIGYALFRSDPEFV